MTGLVFTPLPAPLPEAHDLPIGAACLVTADVAHGFPCRRCLQDAAPGERLVLLSYDPFLGTSPYRQPGPVYVHERSCSPSGSPSLADGVPDQLSRRLLSLRAFDADHLLVDAAVVQGSELVDVAMRLFADERIAYVHVHNAGPGCFAVRIDKAP